jgi:hypothetical protein
MSEQEYNRKYYEENKARLQEAARKYWHDHKHDPEFRKRYAAKNKRSHAKRIVAHRAYVNLSRAKIKQAVFDKFGGRCSNPQCGWVNADGSRGCLVSACLQLDHVNGGGKAERRLMGVDRIYRKALKDFEATYQLLCANCNWIKRFERKEHNLV